MVMLSCSVDVLTFYHCYFQVVIFSEFLLAFMLGSQRAAADQILRELQNNPDMWLQVVHILQNTKSLNTKFFALQVLLFFP